MKLSVHKWIRKQSGIFEREGRTIIDCCHFSHKVFKFIYSMRIFFQFPPKAASTPGKDSNKCFFFIFYRQFCFDDEIFQIIFFNEYEEFCLA